MCVRAIMKMSLITSPPLHLPSTSTYSHSHTHLTLLHLHTRTHPTLPPSTHPNPSYTPPTHPPFSTHTPHPPPSTHLHPHTLPPSIHTPTHKPDAGSCSGSGIPRSLVAMVTCLGVFFWLMSRVAVSGVPGVLEAGPPASTVFPFSSSW